MATAIEVVVFNYSVNVVLSGDLCISTNGLHVSRRTISSMIVIIVYLLSRSIIGLSAAL